MTALAGSSRLAALARANDAAREAAAERCDLCGAVLPEEHRHLLDLESRDVSCACRACALLFDRPAAGGGNRRLIPREALALERFELDDATWEQLRIPVEMAFFFQASGERRIKAFYPSPMGPTESLLGLEAWVALERDNPILATLQPDVQALLVNRARGARDHFLVPIDACYRLVGLIRTLWRGFTGGAEVWRAIEAFFGDLADSARPVDSRAQTQSNAALAAERS